MATKPKLIRAIPKTKIKAFDYNYNFDQFQSYVDEVIGDVSGSMPVGAIYQAIRTDVPVNSLRLDGQEYTSGFDNFILNYLINGKIITKSYVEWQQEYDNNGGNVGFFAYDADTGKFKVPCIQSGTFLAQAVASGEFGSFLNSEIKSHNHIQDTHAHTKGTQNITGWANGIVMNEDVAGTAGGALYLNPANLGEAGFQGDGEYNGYQLGINAANGWTGETSYAQPAIHATGGADTYPKHIRYPFFVVVSNVEAESPSQVVWDEFVGNLDTKLNFDLANISASGKSLVSSFASPSTTFVPWTLGAAGTTYVAPANGHMVIYMMMNANGGGLFLYNNTTQLAVGYGGHNPNTGVCYCLRASRGDILAVDYSGYSSLSRFGFVYDKGEV